MTSRLLGGTRHPVHWMWLSQFLCFQYQLCLTPSHNPHHKNCHRDSVVMSIVQLSNFFNDQWKINHQIWLHDNSLCCVRLDSMLCYNPLLAACEAQLRMPSIFWPLYSLIPQLWPQQQNILFCRCWGSMCWCQVVTAAGSPRSSSWHGARLATTLQPFNQTCLSHVWR